MKKTLLEDIKSVVETIPDGENESVEIAQDAEIKIESKQLFERNPDGLLNNIKYTYNDDGFINYRAIIPLEYLYVNPSNKSRIEKKYGKKYEELDITADKIEDVDLVINLSGIRFLGKIRGITNLDFDIKEASETYCAVKAVIHFIGNFETGNRTVSYSDCANANLQNTNGFGQRYLVEMACNRAYCRTVRSFLGISIVSREELSGNDNVESVESQSNGEINDLVVKLEELVKSANLTFDDVKKKLVKEGLSGAENFTSYSEIPKYRQLEMVSKLQSKKKELKKAKPAETN